MKISVMIGSLRSASYHRKIFDIYRELAKNIFNLHEIPTIDFPLYNADLDINTLCNIQSHAKTIRESSGILFFSPEYNYSIPGHLKNAIDWLSRIEPQPFDGKKASIIGGSPGVVGTARMQYDLRKVGVFLNMHFMNKPEIMISKMYEQFDEKMRLTNLQTIEFLENHINTFSEFIK